MTEAAMLELPFPEFYAPEHSERFDYRPDEGLLLRAAEEWRDRFRVPPAASDRRTVRLLCVDVQKDFCFPEGSLYVGGRSGRGAVEDQRRLAEFIYRNLGEITEIVCTLDTHFPAQIFFPSFWVLPDGRHPDAHQEVPAAAVKEGELRPDPDLAVWLAGGDYGWLKRYAEHYCETLERTGKYRLFLWPPHCLLGSPGHTLAGVLQEARLFHAFARATRNWMEIKGGYALTEHYSALAPEVLTAHDGRPVGAPASELTRRLSDSDVVIVAGEASSHCVRYTVEDLLAALSRRREKRPARVYLLTDCMSPVAVPDPDRPGTFLFDFTPESEAALRRFAVAGAHLVESTRPIAEWPDFPDPCEDSDARGPS